jgi:hypothetical protein
MSSFLARSPKLDRGCHHWRIFNKKTWTMLPCPHPTCTDHKPSIPGYRLVKNGKYWAWELEVQEVA